MIVYIILASYFLITFGLGFYLNKKSTSAESYFMADRGLSTFQLFMTLIATNFSAFFFLGFAAEGYSKGYAYYAMVAFGTSFAAITFYLIGEKALAYGKSKNYVTPVELVGALTKHLPTKYALMFVYLLFIFPYLALQPIGAGLILENLTDGAIPFFYGVCGMILFIIAHILMGGMKGVVLLDVKNGILMLILMILAVFAIVFQLGGFAQINSHTLANNPELFSPRGVANHFSAKKWISYMILFNCSIAILPQLFMRFMISKSSLQLQRSTLLYSIIPIFLFLLPVMIGISGHLTEPSLEGKEADKILSLMLVAHTPRWFAAIVLTGALAAFVSTMDSLLLALGTIFSRDLIQSITPSKKIDEVKYAKYSIVVFALITLIIAQTKPTSIFALGKLTLSAMATIFPVMLLILRWNRLKPIFYFLAIVIPEILLVALSFAWIKLSWFDGFLPVVPAFCLSIVILAVGAIFSQNRLQKDLE